MLKDLLTGLGQLVYPPHKNIDPHRFPLDLTREYIHVSTFCLEPNRPPMCVICSRFLGPSPRHSVCSTCRKFPPAYDFAWSALLYTLDTKTLLHRFKYAQNTGLRHFFGKIMCGFIETYQMDITQFDLIVPIPLHMTRQRERGYNQALLLAQSISTYFNIKICINTLKRVKYTQEQSRLPSKQRWTNIPGAFKINPSKRLEHRRILLVDDLLTTGATASEAAATLKAGGADTVGILTLATAL